MNAYSHAHQGFTVWQLPVLRDNYIYLLCPDATQTAWVIDPATAGVVSRFCEQHGRRWSQIWNTHHHWDHTDGNAALASASDCQIWGPAVEAKHIADLRRPLHGGEELSVEGLQVRVWPVPGHTVGHLAYQVGDALFCGDVLFSAGCGRVFEGTHAQMLASLRRIHDMDEDLRIYCAHEYTETNLRFALQVAESLPLDAYRQSVRRRVDEVRRLRAAGLPSVPSLLAEERRSNPFLQVWDADFRRAYADAHEVEATPLAVFHHMRTWRNHA